MAEPAFADNLFAVVAVPVRLPIKLEAVTLLGNVAFFSQSYEYKCPVDAIVEGVLQPTPPNPIILFTCKPL